MHAAQNAGVARYVMVSAIDVRDRDKGWPDWYTDSMKAVSERMAGPLARYGKAKLEADKELVASTLAWTIVRPSGLLDEPGVGTVDVGKVKEFRSIAREDVAAVVAQVLNTPGTTGLAFDVVGGEIAIAQAVNDVAEQKIDTFRGYF